MNPSFKHSIHVPFCSLTTQFLKWKWHCLPLTVEQNLNTYVPDFKNTVWTFSHRGDLLKIKYENESSLGSWQLLSSLLNNHHADEKLSDMTLAEMFTDQVKQHLSFFNLFFFFIFISVFCFLWPVFSATEYLSGLAFVQILSFVSTVSLLHLCTYLCQFCSREVSQGFDMLHAAYLIMITMLAGLNIKTPFFFLAPQTKRWSWKKI